MKKYTFKELTKLEVGTEVLVIEGIDDHRYKKVTFFEGQVILKKDDPYGLDELVLNVTLKKDKRNPPAKKIIAQIQEKARQNLEVGFNQVNIMDLDQITRSLGMETQLKETRILDLRPKN